MNRARAPSWDPSGTLSASPVAILLLIGSVMAWRMKHKRRRTLAVALMLSCLLAPVSLAQDDVKKPHTFHGKVEKVDRKAARLTVNGEEVEGWMVAMTMAYPVDNPDVLKTIKVGDQIEATVYDRDLSLHNIKVVSQAPKQK